MVPWASWVGDVVWCSEVVSCGAGGGTEAVQWARYDGRGVLKSRWRCGMVTDVVGEMWRRVVVRMMRQEWVVVVVCVGVMKQVCCGGRGGRGAVGVVMRREGQSLLHHLPPGVRHEQVFPGKRPELGH